MHAYEGLVSTGKVHGNRQAKESQGARGLGRSESKGSLGVCVLAGVWHTLWGLPTLPCSAEVSKEAVRAGGRAWRKATASHKSPENHSPRTECSRAP